MVDHSDETPIAKPISQAHQQTVEALIAAARMGILAAVSAVHKESGETHVLLCLIHSYGCDDPECDCGGEGPVPQITPMARVYACGHDVKDDYHNPNTGLDTPPCPMN